jgi:hypothetical protein
MIEFSFVDIALLCWAVLATAKAMDYRGLCRDVGRMQVQILEDKELYDKMAQQWKEAKDLT